MGKFWRLRPEDAILWQLLILPKSRYPLHQAVPSFSVPSAPRAAAPLMNEAYQDVSNVVDACALAGISAKVAQLRPIGCIKVTNFRPGLHDGTTGVL